MLHFTCDLCGCELDDERFVARIEIYPASSRDEFDEETLDADHLEELSEFIAEIEATGECDVEDFATKELRFDLCRQCRRRFLKDPLGRDVFRRMNFSEN